MSIEKTNPKLVAQIVGGLAILAIVAALLRPGSLAGGISFGLGIFGGNLAMIILFVARFCSIQLAPGAMGIGALIFGASAKFLFLGLSLYLGIGLLHFSAFGIVIGAGIGLAALSISIALRFFLDFGAKEPA